MSEPLVIIGSTGANLASLGFALERLGVTAPVSEDPATIRSAEKLILPGVGAAADAMQRLRRAGLDAVIPSLTQPLLGICLGMQLLFEESEEDAAKCLGVMPGRVVRFSSDHDLPIPEMGWNELEQFALSPLFRGLDRGAYAYFVHSYFAPVSEYTIAEANYGERFSAAVCRDNFYGTQFHPERSSNVGALVLRNFLEL